MAVGLLFLTPEALGAEQIRGPHRSVVPYTAGSAVDVALRSIGQKILEQGGPALVIDNKPGGAGLIAATFVKQSQPDARTLFLCDQTPKGTSGRSHARRAWLSGSRHRNLICLAAPAATPDSVVQEINRIFVKAVTSPDIEEKLAKQGIPTMSSSPSEFRKLIAADILRLKPIIEGLPKQ